MRNWLIGLGIAIGCLVASWGLLVLLARRLPPGILRDLVAFIPDCVTTVRRLRKRPAGAAPREDRHCVRWPMGRQPDRPDTGDPALIGPLDDITVVALALRFAARQVPRDVILAAWPGEPRLLERLLGPATPNRPLSTED
jgi:hypothetical protein